MHPKAVGIRGLVIRVAVSQSFTCKGRMQRRLSNSRAHRLFTTADSFDLKGQMLTLIDTATLVVLCFLVMCCWKPCQPCRPATLVNVEGEGEALSVSLGS